MSADIQKLAVIDSRVVQTRPKYAVERGALSLTNAPFSAIAATSSQHTYNIFVPSETVFCDRRLLWTSTANMTMTVTIATPLASLETLAVTGRDWALCALPLNSLCSTLQATINDTTSVINSQDVLGPVLRMVDMKANRMTRTCPTMLDTYQSYNDAFGTLNNPLGGFDSVKDYDIVPNGAYSGMVFTDPTGVALGGNGTVPAFVGAYYTAVNGVPCAPVEWNGTVTYAAGSLVQYQGTAYINNAASTAGTPPPGGVWTQSQVLTTGQQLYFKFTSTEPIVLSPFVFSDENEWETGLFGINNIQLLMTLQSSPSRLVRWSGRANRAFSAIAFNTNITGGQVFQNSRVNVQFLTPPLGVPLPPKSVVPYMEFPRYISQATNGPINPGATGQIQSQTITLPQIPDLLIVYAKPSAVAGADADWYLPLASVYDGAPNPLSINFDNFSGLLSSHTAEELFAISRKNGLKMDWQSWIGTAPSAAGSYSAAATPGSQVGANRQQGQSVPTVGGILVLKPSQDVTLQTGQAPSLVGNFTLQMNLTYKNNSAVPQTPQLYIITVNSGFFETVRGSSRIIKGVLSEQDIINADNAPAMIRSELDRMVGAGSMKSLANVMTKAKEIYERTRPGAHEEGAGRSGAGRSGAGTGAGRSGAGRSGGLERRLA